MSSRMLVLKMSLGRCKEVVKTEQVFKGKELQSLAAHIQLINTDIVQTCFTQPKAVRLM